MCDSFTVSASEISNAIDATNIATISYENTTGYFNCKEHDKRVTKGSYMNIDNKGIMLSAYPVPKLIKQRGDKVIVTWMDDTYTVVVREKDTPDNLYLAFCAAFAKKMFGTTGKVIKAFDNADEREIKRKEAERLAEEAAKKAEEEKLLQEKEQAEYEEAVKERMRLLSIELEALHRLEQEEAAKKNAE